MKQKKKALALEQLNFMLNAYKKKNGKMLFSLIVY